MASNFQGGTQERDWPRLAHSRAAIRAAEHAAAFDAQAPYAPEERREEQVKYIHAICEVLNECGDRVELPGGRLVPWTPKTLQTFITEEFGEGFDIPSLSFEYLGQLKHKLSLRLDQYNDDAAPAGD